MAEQRFMPPLLMAVLIVGACFDGASSASVDVDNLLKFKATMTDPTGALRSWEAGTIPCQKNDAKWNGVLCDNGIVFGLRLENMGLEGSLNFDALGNLPGIRTLSFKGNNFKGAMPNVAKLPRLRALYLSQNHLSGVISADAFSNMVWLRKLHLSKNEFSGPIPTSIAKLERLIELGLDSNKFDGMIPDLKQKELKMVNVSFNNLEGNIPDNLRGFDKNLFAGNKGLCGEPLGGACTSSPATEPQKQSHVIAAAAVVVGTLLLILVVLFVRPTSKEEEKVGKTTSGSSNDFTPEKLEEGSTRSTMSQRRAGEQPRITFVREDRARFELQDLLKSSAEVLGTGHFGCSYKATMTNGSSVVVKRHKDMNKVGKEDFDEHMRRLGRLSHTNLLPLVAYYYKKEEKLMVTDYIPNRSLAKMLHGPNSNVSALDWPTRLKIVKGMATGLNYLYEEFQMLALPHGHLKASNVLLSDSLEPLLADYALLPVMNEAHAAQFMAAFKAPEYKQNNKTSRKSDIWSFGILTLQILTGKIPTTDAQDGKEAVDVEHWVKYNLGEEKIGEIFDKNMKAPKEAEEEMIKLLHIGLACCEENVDKRYDIETLLDKLDELKDN